MNVQLKSSGCIQPPFRLALWTLRIVSPESSSGRVKLIRWLQYEPVAVH